MALEHLPSYSDALTLHAIVSAVSGGLVRLPTERRANTMASSLKDVLGKLQLLVATYVSLAAAHSSDTEDEASGLDARCRLTSGSILHCCSTRAACTSITFTLHSS
jgi:hypothetical protein